MDKVQIYLIALGIGHLFGLGILAGIWIADEYKSYETTVGQKLWLNVAEIVVWTPMVGRIFGWW